MVIKRKTFLKRMIVFILLFTVGHNSLLQAADRDRIIKLKDQTASLQAIFDQVEKQTNLITMFNNDIVDAKKVVTIGKKEITLGELYTFILTGTDLDFEIKGKYIVIVPKKKSLQQQSQRTIKGVVVSSDDQPLPGATIVIEGSTIGVACDLYGRFDMRIPDDPRTTLSVAYIGMKPQKVTVGSHTELKIVLEENTAVMSEVVVTGYQSINRKDMVGSYKVLKMDEIINPAYTTIDNMLQGQVAGMMVTRSSARAGTSPQIKIRGTSTVLGNADPIWVVDGIIQEEPLKLNASTGVIDDLETIIGNQISWLNPNDVETITVLRDASATAVYGSKAANGVIVITTKKGKDPKPSFNYSGSFSLTNRPNYGMFDVMNSKERVQFSDELYNAGIRYNKIPLKNDYTYEGIRRQLNEFDISAEEYALMKGRLETVNTDWLKLLTRTAIRQSHNFSMRGATDKLNYSLSVGYNDEQGQEKGNDSRRITARISVGAQLRNNMNLQVALNTSQNNATSFVSGGNTESVSPLNYALSTSRALPAYNEDGSLLFYDRDITYPYNNEVQTLGYNIFNELKHSEAKAKGTNVNTTLNFSWKFLEGLEYQLTAGYSLNNAKRTAYRGEESFSVGWKYRGYQYGSVEPDNPWFAAALMPFGGDMYTSHGNQNSYNVQNKLLFGKTFNEKHRVNMMLAMEVRSSTSEEDVNTLFGYLKNRGNGLIRPAIPANFKPIGTGTPTDLGIFENLYNGGASIYRKTDNFLSTFATASYSFMNRYVLNTTIRNEVSNRFGQNVNRRFDPIYSFGSAWRMREECFMENVKWLDACNLSATFGIQGNVLTNRSPDLILIQGSVKNNYNEFGSIIKQIPNPNLSWERTYSWNTQADIRLFNAINLTVDYYWKKSNVILSQEVGMENGVMAMAINGGNVYNEGIEGTVSFSPVYTKDFGIHVSVNSSKNWNRGGETDAKIVYGNYFSGSSQQIIKKGYPLGAFWSYAFDGLTPETGAATFKNLKMLAEEYEKDPDPTRFLVYSGTSEPYFTGGMNLSIRYKSLTLSSQFAVLLGGYKRLNSPYTFVNKSSVTMPDVYANLSQKLLRRWKQPGDERNTIYPGLIQDAAALRYDLPNGETDYMFEMWQRSDAMVVSASFVRCNNISLSWNMNKEKVSKLGLTSLSVNGAVSNPFVIASKRFEGFDPELQNNIQPKVFTMGINIGF